MISFKKILGLLFVCVLLTSGMVIAGSAEESIPVQTTAGADPGLYLDLTLPFCTVAKGETDHMGLGVNIENLDYGEKEVLPDIRINPTSEFDQRTIMTSASTSVSNAVNTFQRTDDRVKQTVDLTNPTDQERTYEVTFVYLIRRGPQLQIETDRHLCGLFPLGTWLELLREVGFEARQTESEVDECPLLVGVRPFASSGQAE